MISGAWAVPLFRSGRDFADLRREAAQLQKIENAHLDILRHTQAHARVRIWTMAEFVEAPMEALQSVLDDIAPAASRRPGPMPRPVDLDGFGRFLQNLRNQGMHPYLMGDFPVERGPASMREPLRKLYPVS